MITKEQAREIERQFLQRIVDCDGAASSFRIGIFVTRAEDRARQRCRRAGHVFFKSDLWHITPAGRAYLATLTEPQT